MEQYGIEWLFDSWKYIQEDKVEGYRVLMNSMPMARTPMDEKGASALKRYTHSMEQSLDALVPWQRDTRRLAKLRGKVKPGEVVVLLDAGESSKDPVFADATIKRER